MKQKEQEGKKKQRNYREFQGCVRAVGAGMGVGGALRMRGKHDTSRTSPQPLSCLTETGSRITHKSLELAL